MRNSLVMGQTQFVCSEFGIFVGFMWVRSSVLLDEPGLGRVQSLGFSDFGLDSAFSRLNRFEVRFWWRMNLGSSEFEVRPVRFDAVRSSLYFGSIQH